MILVTGGLGYIGSHTCVELLNNDNEVIIVDNLYNSKEDVKSRIEAITNKKVKLYIGDILDKELLERIFDENKVTLVIHFAGLKAVGESNNIPLDYYRNNVVGTLTLLEVMKEKNIKKIIFSSSATVYGNPITCPIKEDAILQEPTNPYGRTKYFIEYILKDLYKSDNEWSIALLRYFNPIGAHPSRLIGEDPNGIPNNLIPYITKTIKGIYPYVRVFGNDYNTFDGTGVRDYIHVCDLARGHVFAIKKISSEKGIFVYNLGTGTGYSVLDIIKEFSKIVEYDIPYKILERRKGDIDICYADCTKALKELGFKTEKNLNDMCKDSWNWEKNRTDN